MTILILRSAAVVAPTSFSLTFSGTENPLSQGGKFDNGLAVGLDWNDFQAIGGIACAGGISADPAPPYNDSIAILKASAFACPNDQYAEQTIHFLDGYVPPGTHEHGLFIRATLTAHGMTGYEWYIGAGGASSIVRWEGALNSFTPIIDVTPGLPAEDVVRKFTAVGTTISAYENGVLIAQGTDATYASGQTGLQSYMTTGGTPENYGTKIFRTGAA